MSKCNAIDSRHTYVFDYPLTYLLWQFWFAISQFLVHNKNILVQREDVLLLSFFKKEVLLLFPFRKLHTLFCM